MFYFFYFLTISINSFSSIPHQCIKFDTDIVLNRSKYNHNSDFILQHCCCWNHYHCCSVYIVQLAAMMVLQQQMPDSALCFCATVPDSLKLRDRYHSQTYWQTCCYCWLSMGDLPFRRYRCFVHNGLEKGSSNWGHMFK